MNNDFHHHYSELCSALRTDSHDAIHLREEPSVYEPHRTTASTCIDDTPGILSAHAYQQLKVLSAQVNLLQALNASHATTIAQASVNLSRAALADCFDRLSTTLETVLVELQADPS